MADNTLALQVQPTQFGQNVSQGYSTGLAQIGEQQRQEAAAFEQFAAIGLGVMDGNPDGAIDPAKLDQALGLMGNSPIAAKLKENPELLRTITKGSMNVLQFVRDGEKFEMAKQQFEQELAAAQQASELKSREIDMAEKELAWKTGQPLEVSPGATLVDPTTREPILTAPKPEAPESPANDQKLLSQINEERKAAGQPPLTMEAFLASKKDPGFSMEMGPDGTVRVTQGGKLTEGQSKDIGFYTRGLQANEGLEGLEGELTDFLQSKADLIPLGLGNYTRTPEFRRAKVEADNFLAAILRKDTGAAITPKEFELYGPMFLPVPGDDEATMALKRQKRATALLAIRSGLGTAEAVAAANETNLGLGSPTGEARGGGAPEPAGDVIDWTEMDWGD